MRGRAIRRQPCHGRRHRRARGNPGRGLEARRRPTSRRRSNPPSVAPSVPSRPRLGLAEKCPPHETCGLIPSGARIWKRAPGVGRRQIIAVVVIAVVRNLPRGLGRPDRCGRTAVSERRRERRVIGVEDFADRVADRKRHPQHIVRARGEQRNDGDVGERRPVFLRQAIVVDGRRRQANTSSLFGCGGSSSPRERRALRDCA